MLKIIRAKDSSRKMFFENTIFRAPNSLMYKCNSLKTFLEYHFFRFFQKHFFKKNYLKINKEHIRKTLLLNEITL